MQAVMPPAATTAPADVRAARWEARLWPFVVAAALAVLPLLALSLAEPHGFWHDVEVWGHRVVWPSSRWRSS
jgi:hypothetical protein